MDIYFSSKYGFFKHCLIVAPSLPENKKEMILKKKQDIIYFQFDPIIHPGFREKTLPSTYLMMAHYPTELREKDSAFANSLFSTNLILLHYNEFQKDCVTYLSDQSYIFYQNFTNTVDINGVSINMKFFKIKDIQFEKETFLIISGEFNQGILQGEAMNPVWTPTTLIRYVTNEEKFNKNQHIFTKFHDCVNNTLVKFPNSYKYMEQCFDTNVNFSKYLNNYKLSLDMSMVIELNKTEIVNGSKIQKLQAFRWDEKTRSFQVLVDIPLEDGVEGNKNNVYARFDSMQYFVHLVEKDYQETPKSYSSDGRLLHSPECPEQQWLRHRSRVKRTQQARRLFGLMDTKQIHDQSTWYQVFQEKYKLDQSVDHLHSKTDFCDVIDEEHFLKYEKDFFTHHKKKGDLLQSCILSCLAKDLILIVQLQID